jgi:hypothetical protein
MSRPGVDMGRELDWQEAFGNLSRKLEKPQQFPGMFVLVLTSTVIFDEQAHVCMATIYELS